MDKTRYALTPVAKSLYDWIVEYIHDSQGIAPTYSEMCRALNMSSKGEVARLLHQLEERGWIKRLRHRSRAIAIIDASRRDVAMTAAEQRQTVAYLCELSMSPDGDIRACVWPNCHCVGAPSAAIRLGQMLEMSLTDVQEYINSPLYQHSR